MANSNAKCRADNKVSIQDFIISQDLPTRSLTSTAELKTF